MDPIKQTLIALLATAPLCAQLQIDEILVNPVGPNAGNQLIELRNTTGSLNLDGWQLVTGANVLALPPVSVPIHGVVLVHLGAAGTNTSSDLYFPNAAPLSTSDSIALFRDVPITAPTNLVDFVSFGGGTTTLQLALQMVLWAGPQATIPVPQGQGVTMARLDNPGIPSRSPKSWYWDHTPTLGSRNDHGLVQTIGGSAACLGLGTPVPAARLVTRRQANLPWIGETWDLELEELPPNPSTMVLALGTTTSITAFLPAPGITCLTSMTPFAIASFPLAANTDSVLVPVPDLPALVGLELAVQAFVDSYATAFPIGATPTMRVVLGSR
jgi:hypothetical protein